MKKEKHYYKPDLISKHYALCMHLASEIWIIGNWFLGLSINLLFRYKIIFSQFQFFSFVETVSYNYTVSLETWVMHSFLLLISHFWNPLFYLTSFSLIVIILLYCATPSHHRVINDLCWSQRTKNWLFPNNPSMSLSLFNYLCLYLSE